MIRLLESAAAASPEQVAVVGPEGSASYGDLLADARRVAAALQQAAITRFAIVEPDAAWVIRLLAGAALVGAEPCQYQGDIDPAEFHDQATALGHAVVVTRRTDLGSLPRTITPHDLLAPVTTEPTPSDSQPLMIRTTGTTGQPKAARHDWKVLARTVAGIGPRPDQRWLLAYGPQQFAGIQVLQHVVAAHATLVAPFPRQPRDGLDALLRDRVSCISATPTYWRFLLAEARGRKATLPALEQITLGGEAVPADLLVDIKRQFPAARISQVYASTEFGSIASVKDGLPGFGAEALFSDTNSASHIRVVDGELWVRAEAGMLGYAGDNAPQAGTPEEPGSEVDGWRRTGDLVEIVGDRVEFRGRESEVINVGGVKVHPLPIESRITALETVAMARAFGRASRLTGAIVAVEVVPAAGVETADQEGIREEIKSAVSDLPRAWQPRSVTFVDTLETLGSKTVRRMEQ